MLGTPAEPPARHARGRQGLHLVRGASRAGLTEAAPEAYKDVDAVVAVAEGAGLALRVARLRPMAVVKG